ncbi:hypothetical protein [Kribbella antibiotica]|nr:hypothetical protein [Kribbella antibiotica]
MELKIQAFASAVDRAATPDTLAIVLTDLKTVPCGPSDLRQIG